ncbi:MAG: YeeE/YedE family protein [Candidatus Parcubacteria bacterium]|nr:YeeE/YedE family protein [Burkholderiales bacterium]
MHDFTPVSALAGGALIGLASVWLIAANGRIAGISGILHGMVSPVALPDVPWRAWFIGGLLTAGLAWQAFGGPMQLRENFPPGWAAAAGLLVGFGTRMGGGCTSGHGVCGLGRFSLRSLVAVAIFMAAGMGSVYVTRHVLGINP